MSIPPYAPTSTLSHPSFSTITRSKINLDEPLKLYESTQQREIYESLAELYSIIVTLDFLEKCYIRDIIKDHDEYTSTCLRLLAQWNTLLKNENVASEFESLEKFKEKYNIDYPSATSRLKIGVPATVEQSIQPVSVGNGKTVGGGGNGASARAVAEATGNFITCMDALKLNYKAKDQLHPLLSELITSVNKVTNQDFEGRGKIVQWLIKLNQMKANENISDEDARQLLFDLDNAYKVFYTNLE